MNVEPINRGDELRQGVQPRFHPAPVVIDAVLDLIGGETATRSYALVKKGGVMVSTVWAANAELAARAGIRGVNVAMKRSAADLAELAEMVERGDVKPRMGEVFPLDQAREAQDASQQGRAKGKILLRVA